MWLALLFALVSTQTSGVIAGRVVPPGNLKLTKPVQVILLTPEYADRWNSDAQQRLDTYWERYKPTFIQQKQLFAEAAKLAYRDSLQYIVTMMRRDDPAKYTDRVQQSSVDGMFDFKNVALGEYRVFAVGTIGSEDFIWQESIELTSATPRFLSLKTTIP